MVFKGTVYRVKRRRADGPLESISVGKSGFKRSRDDQDQDSVTLKRLCTINKDNYEAAKEPLFGRENKRQKLRSKVLRVYDVPYSSIMESDARAELAVEKEVASNFDQLYRDYAQAKAAQQDAAGEEYVYDVYRIDHDPIASMEPVPSIEQFCAMPDPLYLTLTHGGRMQLGSEVPEELGDWNAEADMGDSEDSNDEGYYANDYPDEIEIEEGGSSDPDGYGGDYQPGARKHATDDMGGQRDDGFGYELSSDGDEDRYVEEVSAYRPESFEGVGGRDVYNSFAYD